jgi:hypothetical protein
MESNLTDHPWEHHAFALGLRIDPDGVMRDTITT